MSILLQIVQGGAAVAETVAETTTEGGGMDIFSLIWKGGIVMIPIGILGVIAVYLSIERYLTIKKASVLDSQFMGNITLDDDAIIFKIGELKKLKEIIN